MSDPTAQNPQQAPYRYTCIQKYHKPKYLRNLSLPIHNHRLQNGATANPIGNVTNAIDDIPEANTHGVDAQVADVPDVRKLDALQLAEDVLAPEVDVLAHQIRADPSAEDASDDHVDSIIILDKNLKHILLEHHTCTTYVADDDDPFCFLRVETICDAALLD